MQKQMLSGQTAIVTGASYGIGHAVAHLFADEGANVVLTARGKDKLDKVVNKMRKRSKIMKKFILSLTLLILFASLSYAESEKTPENGTEAQIVYQAGTQKSFKGPENLFTGDVQVDLLFPSNETAHYSGAYVTFQPGARTAWHLHPAGQHMVVTSGVGLTGTRDGKIIEIKAGDSVWCPPDIDHWHGASPEAPMTHLVLTGILDGENVIWKEKVTDDQYLGK